MVHVAQESYEWGLACDVFLLPIVHYKYYLGILYYCLHNITFALLCKLNYMKQGKCRQSL